MHSSKFVIYFLMITIAQHHGHHHRKVYQSAQQVNILKSKNTFFEEFGMITQTLINDIFDTLNVPKQITEKPKIKLLLRMNYDFNNIVEKNLKLYDILKNITAVDVDSRTIKQNELSELITEILNEKEYNLYNQTEDDGFKILLNTSELFSSEFDDGKKLNAIVDKFNGSLNKLTVDDSFQSKNNINSPAGVHSENYMHSIKIWNPSLFEKTNVYKMDNRRIYGGKKTNIVSYPSVVSIHIEGEFICAGSIISTDLVITAASCLHVNHDKDFLLEYIRATYVRHNSDYSSRLGETISVKKIYFYPQYNPETLQHNLAILRLHRNLKASKILLDRGDLNVPLNTEITILGWGTKEPNQSVDQFGKLAYGVLRVVNIDACKEMYSGAYVTENNICARTGSMLEGIGACNRDVGGPGIIDNLLFGVISFGVPVCGDPNTPTIFTRVGLYIKWIDHIMSLPSSSVATKKRPKENIHYNAPSTYPFLRPIDIYKIQRPTKPSMRADDGDTQEDTVLLREIIDNMKNKKGMAYDLINHDLYDDFIDIFKPEAEESIIQHPLINKTQYLIHGLHYSRPDSPITLSQALPTFLLRSTPNEILRRNNPNITI